MALLSPFSVDTAAASRRFTGPDETRVSPHVHRSRRVPVACAFKTSSIFGHGGGKPVFPKSSPLKKGSCLTGSNGGRINDSNTTRIRRDRGGQGIYHPGSRH